MANGKRKVTVKEAVEQFAFNALASAVILEGWAYETLRMRDSAESDASLLRRLKEVRNQCAEMEVDLPDPHEQLGVIA